MVTTNGQEVRFSFYRPRVSQVELVGDFNGWQVGQLHMKRAADGYWRAAIRLPAGTYRFRYCADGQWFCDYGAFGVEFGPFGPNSVVAVVAGSASPRHKNKRSTGETVHDRQ